MKVAVIAHAGKTLGGGLLELRRVLEAEGVDEPFWYEVPKSQKAPAQVERALDEGAELVFAWGGDGMVQRCVDVARRLATSSLAIVPAGTANLFATNLGIPQDIEEAVAIGLHGDRRKLDVGTLQRRALRGHGRRRLRRGDDPRRRRRPQGPPRPRRLRVDGLEEPRARSRSAPRSRSTASAGSRARRAASWSATSASSSAASRSFEDARPDDGVLELGVVTAEGSPSGRGRSRATAVGTPTQSPFVQTTKARSVKVKLDRKVLLRARRRRPHEGEVVQGQGRARRDQRVRSRAPQDERHEDRTESGTPGSAPGQVAPARRRRAVHRASSGSPAPGSSPAASIYGIIGILALKLALGAGGKATDQQGALKTIAHQPFGRLLLIARRDRPRRLRALAASARRARATGPRARTVASTGSRAFGSGVAYAALCVLASRSCVGSGGSSSAAPEQGDRRRPRLAGRDLARRHRRRGSDRRRALPGLPRPHAEVPRGLEDRARWARRPSAWITGSATFGHLRADGRVRARRHLPDQGRDRLQRRARRSASTARWRSSRTSPTARACSASSPPG